MWFSNILNPERLKKIKGNREIFGFKADMLIFTTSCSCIYNFVFTTSYHQRKTFQEIFVTFNFSIVLLDKQDRW